MNQLKQKYLKQPSNKISIPSIVKAELLLGAYKSNNKELVIDKIERFLQPFEITSFTDQMTYIYAEIRSQLEKKGKIIGPNDLLIASIVYFCNGILITNNTEEFKRVDNLKLENWVKHT